MEPVRVDHLGMKEAIKSGNKYIQVGEKKFLLMEVEEVKNMDFYEVKDIKEEEELLHALKDNNPILSEEEIKRMIRQ